MTFNLFVRDGGCWVLDATVHSFAELEAYKRTARGPFLVESYRV